MMGKSGTASAIARKWAYRPSCVGLLYQGATCKAASAPASCARLEYSIADAVELLPAPAITLARPRATSIVNAITRASSSSVIVALSPVVPQGTSNFTPPSIWRSIRARIRSSSIDPSELNGVTSAVAQPRSQSIFVVIGKSPKSSFSFFRGRLRLQYLIEYLGKFVKSLVSQNPSGRQQRALSKTFTRSRDMLQRDLIGARIESDAVRSRNVSGAC